MVFVAASLVLAACSSAAPVPAASPTAGFTFPKLTGRVVDQADVLPQSDEVALERRLADLEKTTGRQVVVVTINSLNAQPIEDYSQALGNHWRIGRKDINDGLLLVVAPNERLVRIATGKGLTSVLTDAEATSLIQREIVPAFARGDMRAGIRNGASGIIAQLAQPAA